MKLKPAGGESLARTRKNRPSIRIALHASPAEDLPDRMGRDDPRLPGDRHHARPLEYGTHRRDAEEVKRRCGCLRLTRESRSGGAAAAVRGVLLSGHVREAC